MARYKDPKTGIVSELTESQVQLNPQLFGTFELVAPETPVTTAKEREAITSASLTSVTTPQVIQPAPTPVSPASNVDASLSEPEENISKLIKRVTELESAATGKTAFTQEQEQQFGLPALRETQKSISKQILALQAEEKNIPNVLQQQATGRGITAGGLQPLETGALRENAIKANILGAQLAASQLDLASAQGQVDRAVAMKFGPQEEEIKAKIANLDLLSKDPALTLAEKNRANAQAIKLKKTEEEIAQKKAEQADIWKVSTDASTNISNFKATAQYPVASLAIQAIQNAKTREEALRIAAEAGLTKTPTSQSDFEQAFLRDKGRLPTVQELLNFKQQEQAVKTAGMVGDTTGLPSRFVAAMQSGQTGDILLSSLSPIDKATIQSILDYTKNPANLSLRKVKGETKSEREKFLSMAHLIDPTYDETQYGARSAIKKDFTSGKSAQNIRSLNTAVGHLETLSETGTALANSSVTLWNKIANKGLTAIGDPRVVKFETAATAVESELASVFKGMGATDQEIKAWRENINSSQSPAQIKGAVDTAITLMGSRLQALTNQYEIGIGKPKDFRILSDKSRQILQKLGIDVEALDPIREVQNITQPQAKEGDVKNYNGVNYKVINGVWTPQ